ncbi:MAG: glycosyltransferase family 87 protein [Candidatus Sedimenticola sp. (ex Thyasira tokunagai)]
MNRLIKQWEKNGRFRISVLIVAVTLFAVILLSSQSRGLQWENHPSDFGTRDFVAFWSAFHAVKDGKNPYSMSEIYPFQSHVIKDEVSTQAFLNPPWSLAVLAPVIALDFASARFFWIVLNIIFLFVTITLILNYLHSPGLVGINNFLAAVLFLPSFWTLWLGQPTVFLTACFAAAVTAILKGRGWLAGLLLIPLTLKPHLFLVVGVVLAVYVLRRKSLPLIVSFITGFLTLQLVTYLFEPKIYTYWLNMEFSPLILKTSSLVTMLRESIMLFSGSLMDWPVVAVPAIGTALSLPWFLRRLGECDIELLIPPALCISLGIAPYAWLHDFALLLVCQATLLVLVARMKPPSTIKMEIIFMLLGLQLAIVITISITHGLQYVFWVPWAMLTIWVRSLNLLYVEKIWRV